MSKPEDTAARDLPALAAAMDTLDADTIERRATSTIDPARSADQAGLAALLHVLGEDSLGTRGISVSRTLGEGGMGVVKLGTQLTLGREVALKMLRAGAFDEPTRLRLVREAWVTGSLEHPNIVPVHDVRVDADGRPMVVLKRIQGVHWGELLTDPESARQVFGETDLLESHLRVLIQVANALHFAHTRNIIHRDVKPENVMVGSFGEVYVLDWGLAVSLAPDPTGRLPLATDATDIAGTPCYMAPEMIGATQQTPLSVRTDVYLLGATLFEVVEGRPPREGTNLATILSEILTVEPTLTKDPTGELASICRKALARAPCDRFESALAFRLALEQFLEHRSSIKLAARAMSTLQELRQHVEAVDDSEPEGRANRIRSAFGAVRFGFRAALDAWPENEEAERGLIEATSHVVELELATGNPHTASTLLDELGSPPAGLRQKVDVALRARSAQDQRRIALEQDQDPTIGSRTRLFVATVLGVLWTVSPLFAWYVLYRERPPSHEATMRGTVFILLVVLAISYWGRQSLRRTALNRGLVTFVLFALIAHLVLEAGAILAGIPEMQAQVFKLFLWFSVVSLGTITLERRAAPLALVMGAAFLLAAARPSWAFALTSGVNAVTTVLLGVIWWPKRDPSTGPPSAR